MKRLFLVSLFFSVLIFGKEWVYEGHFPVLPQPWYFYPADIAVDRDGYFYVSRSDAVFKIDSNGNIIKYVKPPILAGPFNSFNLLEVDSSGNVFVKNSTLISNKEFNILVKIDKNGNVSLGPMADFEAFLIDKNDNFYFVYPDKIEKRDSNFNKILEFGSLGQGPGQFYLASNIAIAENGNIYVVDSGNYRVQVFDQGGNFLFMFGSKGSNPEQFLGPSKIFSNLERIYIYDSDYFYTGSKKIKIFDLNGNFISQWGEPGNSDSQLNGVPRLLYQNKIYFCNAYNSTVKFFSLDGTYLGKWSASGTEEGKFNEAWDIDVSNSGNIYIADSGNFRFQKFNKKNEFEFTIGSYGIGPKEFLNLKSICVDMEENIFILDDKNKAVQKFDKKGNFKLMWKGDNENLPYYFDEPWDMAVDKDGYVYILCRGYSYILKFTNNGSFTKRIDLEWNLGPIILAVDNQGNFYVSNVSSEIEVYSQDGELIRKIDFSLYFKYIVDIDIDNQGRIFLIGTKYDNYLIIRAGVFTNEGVVESIFGDGGGLIKDLNGLTGISASPEGKAYILEGHRVSIFRPKPGLALSIPASASTKGANGTYWKTDLSIFNPSEQSIDLKLNYFSNFGNKEIDLNLGGYGFLSLKDIISNTFGMPETFGAITSICLNETQPVLFSRTYTESVKGEAWSVKGEAWNVKGEAWSVKGAVGAELAQPDLKGTYGQGIRASPYKETFYQGEKAYLIGLKNNENFRTNIGFFNLKEFPVDIKLKLHNEEGEEIASSEYNLDGFGHLQINNIFSSLDITKEYNASYAIVWTDTLDGRFAAYSSIVDNETGDPVYIEGEGYGSYNPDDFEEIIPVVASKEGANGTNWKTEVVLTNVGAEEQEVEIVYHISGQEGIVGAEFIQPYGITLKPGEVRYFKDILTEFFSYPESFGWLKIRHSSSGLKVRARVYNEGSVKGEAWNVKGAVGAELVQPDLKGTYGKFVGAELAQPNLKGTYGQGVKAINISKFSKGETYLIDLEENEDFRTNFGLLPLSVSVFRDVFVGAEFIQPDIEGIQMPLDQNKSLVKFKLDLIKDGQIIDEKEIEAEEENLLQINNILSTLFSKTGPGYVLKIIPEEGANYTSYISKVDNITGDAIFQSF